MVLGAPKLRILKLISMTLQGVEEDLQACKTALYAHPSLKQFDLVDCTAAVQTLSVNSLELAGKKVSAAAVPKSSSSIGGAIKVETSARVA